MKTFKQYLYEMPRTLGLNANRKVPYAESNKQMHDSRTHHIRSLKRLGKINDHYDLYHGRNHDEDSDDHEKGDFVAVPKDKPDEHHMLVKGEYPTHPDQFEISNTSSRHPSVRPNLKAHEMYEAMSKHTGHRIVSDTIQTAGKEWESGKRYGGGMGIWKTLKARGNRILSQGVNDGKLGSYEAGIEKEHRRFVLMPNGKK